MAEERTFTPVRRLRPSEGVIVTSEMRWLMSGDIFWYESGGSVDRLPNRGELERRIATGYYQVAVGGPIWHKKKGERVFAGIKYREATEKEIHQVLCLIIDNRRSLDKST